MSYHLNIYEKNELESAFIEIGNPRKSNIIVRVIYGHPSMDLTDFTELQLLKQTIREYLQRIKVYFPTW